MKRSFNKTRVWATANKEQSIASIIAILDEFPELNFEEKEKIIEIYKVIRSSQVISIEDLPYKVARHMRSYEDESGNNRKGIEELVQILREKSLIENEDEISLRLNPTARITSEKKLEQVNIFIGAFFQALQHSHSSTDKGEEVVIDLQYFNTLLSKELQMDTLRDMIDNLLLLRKQQHWVSLNGNIMLFHSSLSDIQTKTNLLLLQGQVLLPLLLQGQVSEHQKNTTNILVEKKLKILATQLGKSMNSFIDILALETLLKFLHTFEILNVEAGLFLYRTKFLILEGVLAKERFTDEQYEDLRLFYEKKTQQAHIMEELAHRILRGQSLDTFVEDYFNLSQEDFISSYFQRRRAEIKRSISKSKYEKIHKDLSEKQREILDSKNNLLIIAGPGAGKTKSLVHKVASLILEEGVRKEEFLLLSFSRSAKYELKNRIIQLIGTQGYFLDINTFHGYAFKLLGRNALKEDLDKKAESSIIKDAITYLENNVDLQLPFSVIMLDEFQDINDDQFRFVEVLQEKSFSDKKEKDTKIIATGDDDQSIYEFQGGNITYIQKFKNRHNAEEIILGTNYRSTQKLIDFTDTFIQTVNPRIKAGRKLVSGRTDVGNILNLFGAKDSLVETWDCTGNYLPGVLKAIQKIKKSDGTTAIICHDNETGLIINTLLKKQGLQATLLLKDQGYRFSDTLEMQYFLTICKSEEDSKNKVNLKNVEDKYKAVLAICGQNKNTQIIRKVIDNLKATNTYLTPEIVEEFIVGLTEVDLTDDNLLSISTFHKAKGREFDNVIICFDTDKDWKRGFSNPNTRNQMKRLIYVGMTRAKNNLILLGNSDSNPYFKELLGNASIKNNDTFPSDDPTEISLITSCSDVQLGRNKGEKLTHLIVLDEKVEYRGGQIISSTNKSLQGLSANFKEKLQKYIKKGYKIFEIKVYQRLFYPLEKGKRSVVYLFQLDLRK